MTNTRINSGEIISCISGEWMRNFVLPSYTPARWWECDVFEVTPSGYWREYEVKVSRSDFKIDAQKERIVSGCLTKKHDLLRYGSTDGPSRFSFVTPAGLIVREELPEWAGLIEVMRETRTGRCFPSVSVKAPKLHGEKIDEQRLKHAKDMCYYRMHRAFKTPVVEMCEEGSFI